MALTIVLKQRERDREMEIKDGNAFWRYKAPIHLMILTSLVDIKHVLHAGNNAVIPPYLIFVEILLY